MLYSLPPDRRAGNLEQEPAAALQVRIDRTLSPPPTLRARIRRHNWHVAGLSLATLLGAAALWLAAYGIAYWLMLLALSATVGEEAQPLPYFRDCFIGLAATLLFFAWLHRRLNPDERPRDRKTAGEVAFDFVLLIPRMTLAVWGNLSAWLSLNAAELQGASDLLERVRAQKKVPLQTAPIDLPEEKSRERVLLSLLLLELLEIRKEDGALWLRPLVAEP